MEGSPPAYNDNPITKINDPVRAEMMHLNLFGNFCHAIDPTIPPNPSVASLEIFDISFIKCDRNLQIYAP